MSTSSTVARNTVYLSLSSTLALCIALGFNIFLARTFGVDRFGEYSFALGFISLFSVFVEFSLDPVIVRDVAQDPIIASTYFGNALLLKGLLFLLASGLILATVAVMGYPAHIRLLLYILSLGLVFDCVTRCCTSLFSAVQQMQFPAILVLMEKLLFALLGLVVVSLQGSVMVIAGCYVAAQVATQVVSMALIRRKLGLKPEHVGYGFCKQLVRCASSFFGISMIAAIYADIDKLFLFSMQGEMAIGLYAAAYKLATIPTRFSSAFHQAIYPVLSKHAASSDRRLLTETYRRSLRCLLFGAVPLAVGTTVLAEPIMGAVYGQAYVSGAIALQIVTWAYALEFFNPFFARALFAVGRQRIVLAAAILGAGSNIILNIILIPYYSFVGAALATLGSAGLVFVALSAPVLRMFPDVSLGALTLRPALAGLLMWTVCTVLRSMPLILLAILGALVYCGCLLLSKAFLPDELLILRRLLRDSVLLGRKTRSGPA